MDDAANNYNPDADEDDGSCTYEPDDTNGSNTGENNSDNSTNPTPCDLNFTFYSIELNWQNNTTMKILWDADATCPDTYAIEIDIVIKKGNETIMATTVRHNITGNDGISFSYLANDLNQSSVCDVELTIWHNHEGNLGWQMHEKRTELTS